MEIKYLIIHHSASGNNLTIEDIRRGHIAKGFSDIGYHKVIYQDGSVHQGRSDAVIGAQAFGANAFSLGICCIGNFETSIPNDKVVNSLVTVLSTLCKRHKLTVDKIIGHRDVAKLFNVPEGATACPGNNMYKLLPSIRERVKKYL